jgi:hypothetical protein
MRATAQQTYSVEVRSPPVSKRKEGAALSHGTSSQKACPPARALVAGVRPACRREEIPDRSREMRLLSSEITRREVDSTVEDAHMIDQPDLVD